MNNKLKAIISGVVALAVLLGGLGVALGLGIDLKAAGTILLEYAIDNADAIAAYLLAGGGISVLLQFLKKLRDWESAAWIQSVLFVFSGLAAVAEYVINNNSTTIAAIFGDTAPKILAAALVMHRLVVSPFYKLAERWLINQLREIKQNKLDAAAYRQEQAIKAISADQQLQESQTFHP